MTILSYPVAFFLTLHMLLVLSRLAPRLGLIDHPGGRKAHRGAVPLVGGLAMFVGFALALLTLDQPIGPLRALLAGAALLVITGVLDDMQELSSASRFAIQIGVALLMIFWGRVELVDLGHLVSEHNVVTLGIWGVPLTVFATVGVINALNMADGVDGVAGSISGLTLFSLVLVAWTSGAQVPALVLGLLLVTVLGFLTLNLRLPWQKRARVFMGDAGSMFLGFALAWFLIDFTQGERRLITPVTALWLLGIPLIDTVTMMLRRLLRGGSPFRPDREHFHHLLLMAGFSPRATLSILLGISSVMVLVGLLAHFYQVAEWKMFYLFLALFAAHYGLTDRAWRTKRFLGRVVECRRDPDHRADYAGEERRSGNDRRDNA
jgi:UDP-GlcNAc:undecaprenyl-phosphate/decaprenyl-phosphate GlcNAc-1-phosphate transferase